MAKLSINFGEDIIYKIVVVTKKHNINQLVTNVY